MAPIILLSVGLLPLIGLAIATIHSVLSVWNSGRKFQYTIMEMLVAAMGITPSMYIYKVLSSYLEYKESAIGLSIFLATLQIAGMAVFKTQWQIRFVEKKPGGSAAISIPILMGALVGLMVWFSALPITLFFIQKPI